MMNQIVEDWKQIAEFPEFAVSNYGRVMRIALQQSSRRTLFPVGMIRKAKLQNNGYLSMTFKRGRHTYHRPIHRLVAMAFIGPLPAGGETNHLDGNKLNNFIGNLEYTDRVGNARHAMKLGRLAYGERNALSKLTNEKVRWLRQQQGKQSLHALSRQLGMDRKTLRQAILGITWRHVPLEGAAAS